MKQVRYPGKTYSVVLEVEPSPLPLLGTGKTRNNLRIIRESRQKIASEMKTRSWQFNLEPGYGVPEIGCLIDGISRLSESEAMFKLAVSGHQPDFIFRFDAGNALVEVQDVENGEILYKAPGGK